MKIKNEKELFALYVKEDAFRPILSAPFIQKTDGRVWASDSTMLILVNKACVRRKYETTTLIGNDLKVRDYNTDIPLTVSQLQAALDRCPQVPEMKVSYNYIKCPECGGKGHVDVEYLADYDGKMYDLEAVCPICDGEGSIERKDKVPTGRTVPHDDWHIRLGEGNFLWPRIDTVIKTCRLLGIENLRLLRTDYREMSIIELSEDIHVAVMPARIENEKYCINVLNN